MKTKLSNYRARVRAAASIMALLGLVLTLSGVSASAAPSNPDQKSAPSKAAAAPALVQYFQDIPTGNFFYAFTAQLYIDGVVSGYTCGAAPAGPCVPPDNLPYYVPNNAVTRGLMSIYIDNARSKPFSTGVTISTTDYTALFASTTSGGYGVQAECVVGGTNCYAVEGYALTGDYSGYFYGGRGLHSSSSDAGYPAVNASASGAADAIHGVASDSTDTSVFAGGVFTDTQLDASGIVGYGGAFNHLPVPGSSGAVGYAGSSGEGVFGQDGASGGYGAYGDAENYPNGNGDPSAIGLAGRSYDGASAHTGLRVFGAGLATGGFSTGLGYSMMVKYDGTDELHPGDIVALDGNNTVVNENKVLGTVKANAQNAGAAIGVAQYRYNLYSSMSNTGMRYSEQADTTTTSFQQGDVIEIMVVGQTDMKVTGKVNIGDRLSIGDGGAVPSISNSADSIGKVAGEPDVNGMVTVFVNFK